MRENWFLGARYPNSYMLKILQFTPSDLPFDQLLILPFPVQY